ncbi:hypothetical protein [Thermococcus sp. Bubb.Bath]|uniref:hypothetical protein n=1 Tax=Thermococcus sp. Bubb.Bath TaxID=1638242 RepID=UPI00143BD00B|nr:hypothetical protein [Thermococcus sp. Bubb.Bath]
MMPVNEVHDHSAPGGRQKGVNSGKLPVKESPPKGKPILKDYQFRECFVEQRTLRRR